MKQTRYIIAALAIAIIMLSSVIAWMTLTGNDSALKHETNRWAAIKDSHGNMIAVETNKDEIWQQLVQLNQNRSVKFIGSIVAKYGNKWGFRLKPENLTIADFTAEGLQATIQYISSNLDYWIGSWAYISAKVVETHE